MDLKQKANNSNVKNLHTPHILISSLSQKHRTIKANCFSYTCSHLKNEQNVIPQVTKDVKQILY